jgi:hypothetical protein
MAKSKLRIPRSIAGIKVPRRVRKSRTVKALLASPVGREVVAAALTAAVGAAGAALASRVSPRQPDRSTAGSAETIRSASATLASLLAGLVTPGVSGTGDREGPAQRQGRDRDDPVRPPRHDRYGNRV